MTASGVAGREAGHGAAACSGFSTCTQAAAGTADVQRAGTLKYQRRQQATAAGTAGAAHLRVGQLGNALQVVLGAGGDAAQHDLLRCAPPQRHGHHVLHLQRAGAGGQGSRGGVGRVARQRSAGATHAQCQAGSILAVNKSLPKVGVWVGT